MKQTLAALILLAAAGAPAHAQQADPGQKPFLCVPFDGTATRVKLAAMCVPTPTPAPPK